MFTDAEPQKSTAGDTLTPLEATTRPQEKRTTTVLPPAHKRTDVYRKAISFVQYIEIQYNYFHAMITALREDHIVLPPISRLNYKTGLTYKI